MKQKNITSYSTTDLIIAAFLRTKRFKLLDVERGNGGRAKFVFQDESNRSGLIMDLVNRGQKVEPFAFMDELRSLKAMCYEA